MPLVSGGGDASKDGSIRYAMAMKVKYRKHKKVVQLALLGVHPSNRAGVYPGPDRVVQLGVKILLAGCDPNEANHAGVCVQEVPPEKRAPLSAVSRRAVRNDDGLQHTTLPR